MDIQNNTNAEENVDKSQGLLLSIQMQVGGIANRRLVLEKLLQNEHLHTIDERYIAIVKQFNTELQYCLKAYETELNDLEG